MNVIQLLVKTADAQQLLHVGIVLQNAVAGISCSSGSTSELETSQEAIEFLMLQPLQHVFTHQALEVPQEVHEPAFWRKPEQEMIVVGHQSISAYTEVEFAAVRFQRFEKYLASLFVSEYRDPAMD